VSEEEAKAQIKAPVLAKQLDMLKSMSMFNHLIYLKLDNQIIESLIQIGE